MKAIACASSVTATRMPTRSRRGLVETTLNLFRGKPNVALRVARKTLVAAEECGVGLACYADACLACGQWPDARAGFEEAQRFFATTDDWSAQGDVLYGLAVLRRRAGELERSQEMMHEARALYGSCNEHFKVASALLQLAVIAEAQGDSARVMPFAQDALARAEGLQHPIAIARTRLRMGTFLKNRGQYEEARASVRAALKVFEEIGTPRVSWGVQRVGGESTTEVAELAEQATAARVMPVGALSVSVNANLAIVLLDELYEHAAAMGPSTVRALWGSFSRPWRTWAS